MNDYSKDIEWINALKAVCMFLVYINHSEIYYGTYCSLFGYIYRPIFVNAFFFISGYLLFKKFFSCINIKNVRTLIIRNIYKLIIPTIFFSVLFYFPKKILRGEICDVQSFLCDTIGGGSIWFTAALFVAQFLLLILLLSKSKLTCMIGSLFMWGIAAYLVNKHILIWGSETMPWYYKSGMQAVVIMVIGGFFVDMESKCRLYIQRYKWPLILLFLVYAILSCYFHSYIKTALDWQVLNIMGLFVSIIGIFTLIEFVKYLPSCRIINYIGRHSIGFYFFCGSIVNVFAVIGKLIFPNGYIFVIIIAISAYLFSLLLVWLINTYLPFIYDLRLIKKRRI